MNYAPNHARSAAPGTRGRHALALAVLLALCLPVGAQEEGGGFGPGGGPFGPGNMVRGTVTAVGPDTVTLRTDEGDTYKVSFGVNTRMMKDRQPMKAADIHVGDMLVTAGTVDQAARTVGAAVLFEIDAEQVRKLRETFGKTWTGGRVTAIDDLTLTIERFDKQKQTITVDENTSFRKRRESITLPEIKVGDMVRADGALHGDTFVATVLNVMGPRPGRGGPNGPGGSGGPAGQGGPPPTAEPPAGAPPQ